MNESFLTAKLAERKSEGNLRSLPNQKDLVDFVSNDYLGLSRSQKLFEQINRRVEKEGVISNGGTGSRLLSGNHNFYESLEDSLREIFQSEAVLTFNSGYAANQALVSSVAAKGDTIIYDQLSHVCLKEGAWLSAAQTVAFFHNDLDDLKKKIGLAQGRVFVVTETIFSMDGDIAPLKEIASICHESNAFLIVDEAHSTGIAGEKGAGMLIAENLHESIFARVYTFGKAMGVHGACVAGSQTLIDYLVNFGRPFIYTTSMPPHSIISIEESFKFLVDNMDLQKQLEGKIRFFKSQFPASISDTAIQPILIGSNTVAKSVSSELQTLGYDVRPVLSPTVKRGTERIRICLHVYNSDNEISELVDSLNRLLPA